MDKKSYNRLQVSLSDSLHEKIEAYADMMGVSIPEAARHLMLRGLEQVQLLMNSKSSVDAINRMTATFDRGLELEEKERAKRVRGRVTPEPSFKSETTKSKSSPVEDIFP